MGKSVLRWQSEDGELFDSEAAMLMHEFNLATAERIQLFLNSKDISRVNKKTEYANILTDWEQWRIAEAGSLISAAQAVIAQNPTNDDDMPEEPPDHQLSDDEQVIDDGVINGTEVGGSD